MERYTLNLDKNNYVLSIAHTSNDNIELDLSKYDLIYLSAYKLVKGKLVLDNFKLDELKAEEEKRIKAEEVAKLKQELANTDYEAIKYSEGWFTEEEYAPIKTMREELREKIRELLGESNFRTEIEEPKEV